MSRSPIILPPALQPLAAQDRSVAWKLEKNKKGKPTKVPYRADAPDVKAKSNDSSTWRGLVPAMDAYVNEQCDGIMFALEDSSYGAYDLDDVRNAESGEIHPWAADKIDRAKSYVEVTPSGEGLRIIGLATGDPVHRVFPIPNANRAKVELYGRATRFITVTGHQIGGTATLGNIDALPDQTLDELDGVKKRTRKPKHLDKLIKDGCGQDFDGDRSRAVWFVIHALLKQGRTTSSPSCSIAATAFPSMCTISPAPRNTRAGRSRRRRTRIPNRARLASKTASRTRSPSGARRTFASSQ
jgi:hypothetical protein